uniref:Uncharacterized protein n=1 Tax=Utricularia reniformis TaxID=192314 RepID=A0A1Y0B3E9_9LAMI|nr:hypothetical protein AEK19_MT1805 [Utricularia reniformis]ART31976.1 hypothetical protein AEK19_MT1805 [Utricularia reniformis]
MRKDRSSTTRARDAYFFDSAALQKAYGGDHFHPKFPISAPTIIPSFHRKMIYVGDERADLLVQFYMSLFSLTQVRTNTSSSTPSG